MKSKIIIGSALTVFISTVVIYGGLLMLGVFLVVSCIAMWEYYKLLQIKKIKPMIYVGMFFGCAFMVLAYMGGFPQYEIFRNSSGNIGTVITVYVFVVLIIQFWQIVQRRERYGMVDLAATVFGSLYIGAFGSFMFLLVNIAEAQFPGNRVASRLIILLPMFGAWGSDVGAYFAGKFFGRNRIFPELSPKKTLEGCMGGMAYATMIFLVISFFIGIPFMHALILGIVTSTFGQIGDLVESAFKRELGIKDSSTLLGSHGGMLDRLDSFLFTMPVVYYYFAWFRPWG